MTIARKIDIGALAWLKQQKIPCQREWQTETFHWSYLAASFVHYLHVKFYLSIYLFAFALLKFPATDDAFMLNNLFSSLVQYIIASLKPLWLLLKHHIPNLIVTMRCNLIESIWWMVVVKEKKTFKFQVKPLPTVYYTNDSNNNKNWWTLSAQSTKLLLAFSRYTVKYTCV